MIISEGFGRRIPWHSSVTAKGNWIDDKPAEMRSVYHPSTTAEGCLLAEI